MGRFYLSIQEGLRPAGRELRTNDYVPRPIPEGCYDTGDGFYDPKIKCVVSARDLKKVLRLVRSPCIQGILYTALYRIKHINYSVYNSHAVYYSLSVYYSLKIHTLYIRVCIYLHLCILEGVLPVITKMLYVDLE